MTTLRALSVKQPWAHAIAHLGKDIENRGMRYGHRGLTLIHASAAMDAEYYFEAAEFMRRIGVTCPPAALIERGGIIGAVEIIDAVREHRSGWWMGPCGLVLRNARAIPFIPCKGTVAPLFWIPPADVVERAEKALRGIAT